MYHLRQLQCAVSLAHHRHFVRAADAIGITQSGLTQSIARLEHHYGVRLFDRSRDGVTPTAFGEVLLEGARDVLDRLDDVARRIDLMDELESGELSVGVDPMLASEILAPAFAELLSAHPRLRFRVRTGSFDELMQALESGVIDLFVGFPHPSMGSRVNVTTLELPAPRVVLAPDHPLLDIDSPAIADYLAYPLVQGPIAHWYLDWLAAELERLDLQAEHTATYFLHTDDVGMLVSIVRRSRAVLAAMWEDVRLAIESGELVECPPPNWPSQVSGALVSSATRVMLPAAERLSKVILQHAAARTAGKLNPG